MGITPGTIEFERNVLKLIRKGYPGLKWCELGCQKDLRYNIPSRLVYKKLNVQHTSFDINGKFGSIKFDLTKQLPVKFNSYFEVITDYGTLEHITNQYGAFKNIHGMCQVEGIMIHILPYLNNWENHGLFEYSPEFFKELSKLCNYDILKIEILDKNEYSSPYNLIAVALIKKKDNSFPPERSFNKLDITKTNFLGLTEDYEKKGVYTLLSYLKTSLYALKWKLIDFSPS